MEDANGIPINVKIEGYWYSQYETQWPKPIPNALTESEAGEIFSLIKKKEKEMRRVGYKGYSKSRFTGERLSSYEFESKEWVFPELFAEHYVLLHRVRPTDEFLKFIGYAGS